MFGVTADHVVDDSSLGHRFAGRAKVELVTDVPALDHLAVKHVADPQATDCDLTGGQVPPVYLVGVGRLHLFTPVVGEIESDAAVGLVIGCPGDVATREDVVVGGLGIAGPEESGRVGFSQVHGDVIEPAVAHATEVHSVGSLGLDQDVQPRDGQRNRSGNTVDSQASRVGWSRVVQHRQQSGSRQVDTLGVAEWLADAECSGGN